MNFFGRNHNNTKTEQSIEDPAIHAPPMEAFHPQEGSADQTSNPQSKSPIVESSTIVTMEMETNNSGNDDDDNSEFSDFEDVELAEYVNHMSNMFEEEDKQRRVRRRRQLVGVVAVLVVVAITLGAVLPSSHNNTNDNNNNTDSTDNPSTGKDDVGSGKLLLDDLPEASSEFPSMAPSMLLPSDP
eukprot:CAMPEP_0116555954 /NCGR_PEP_ID=MMETSP0397-20121206/8431_1 /TAXON_ID=216820 /ORGANISM="Cyclophora tenuis, Strain ECT3854" /LENGTH=184 /DNA_ID=CAMNT_0004081277 /DNA_START=22 /DNA_END=576 /DNA_ORIENTATION=-